MPDKLFTLSVKIVILDDENRCLLLKRSMQSKANAGQWDFPGGKIDAGEGIQEALLREVAEETGLTVSLVRVVGSAESETPSVRVAYLILEGRVEKGSVRISSEHDEYIWISISELPNVELCAQFRPFALNYAHCNS